MVKKIFILGVGIVGAVVFVSSSRTNAATNAIAQVTQPSAVSTAPTAAKKAAPFYYGVWLPYWRGQDGATDIATNLDRLHEVSPFSYKMRWDGTLIDYLNIDGGSWSSWFSAVHDAGVKVIPTIAWFDSDGLYNLLSVARTRQATEDRVAALVKANGFDGIDIDFESMYPATRPYYSLFIQGLAMRLHPQKKLLTCTVMTHTNPAVTYAENYASLNQNCDSIRLMAYDQQTIDRGLNVAKGNGTLYSPVADTDWVKSVLTIALRSISPRKLMLGIPTYGYEYQVSWNGGTTTYERVRAFDFMQAMDRADSLGISPLRNNAGELSFTFTSSTHIAVSSILRANVASTQPAILATNTDPSMTTFFVSFPDAQSILDKINLAKQFGIRGAVLFKADGDIDPLVWEYMQ
jgi:spore germination protein YaaH